MILLNNKLSRHQAPLHFAWADHNLYTLPVRNVKLFPVFPSENQKNYAWKFDDRPSEAKSDPQTPTPDAEVNALVFQSYVNSDLSVDLRVPYIPYSHFMGTVSFEKGDPYLEYVKAAEDYKVSRSFYEEAEANTPMKISKLMDGLEPDLVDESEEVRNVEACPNLNVGNYCLYPEFCMTDFHLQLGSYGHVSEVQGFFNCVPTDSSLLLGETFGPQLNLVSSKWADWKHFTLHPPPNNTHLLELADGTEIACHGYISGTWTDINLQLQRKISKLFVVDAVFSAANISDDTTYLFALSADALESPRYHELSGIEKRTFCGKLNPSLYRLRIVDMPRFQAVYRRKMKGGQVNNASEDDDFWEEMNRRELWDRDYERRKPASQEDKDELKRALSIEEHTRSAWDERHRYRQSVSEAGTGDSSVEAAQSPGKVETKDKKPSWSGLRQKLQTLF